VTARILVVRGGIAALAARALARASFSVELVERRRTWDGAGIYLPGNASRALRALGLKRAALERGRVIRRGVEVRGLTEHDETVSVEFGDGTRGRVRPRGRGGRDPQHGAPARIR
jgi:2-polyprenyl-6-methoxyphenol hydroxylase-like FAD-dependent oxidoreductase